MDELYHYGTKRHSGRYKWGSGENPYQHEDWFLSRVNDLRKQGLDQKEIALALGITQKNKVTGEIEGNTGEYRHQLTIARNQSKANQIFRAKQLKSTGMSNVAIGKEMGIGESQVRNLLKDDADKKLKEQQQAVEILRRAADKKKYVDVGVGVERNMNISEEALKVALQQLKNEGYNVYNISVRQLGTDFNTTVRVLTPPGKTYKDVYDHEGDIKPVQEYLSDDKLTVLGIQKPKSVDSKRIEIIYDEDGGSLKDGVIELRKGVEDLSLGNSKYAQVRIAVDDKYYLKGMAMYADDLPDGVDIRVNSNKSRAKGFEGSVKKLKLKDEKFLEAVKKLEEKGLSEKEIAKSLNFVKDDGSVNVKGFKEKLAESKEIDWDNPFGSYIKKDGQREYIDENGHKQLSVINKVNEEGDWAKWSKSLSAQFLAKQDPALIKTQLTLSLDNKRSEYDDIKDLTNPTVKKQLLESFADDCDASAVHLKAAALPRQSSKVILPFNTLGEKEIYAPTYNDGEELALIRYPHGGIFEIPVLTVNNRNKEGIKRLGKDFEDAVGINPVAAKQLSGADFDGDTVLIIPTNNKVGIKHTDYLKDLKGWDDEMKEKYAYHEGMTVMTPRNKQKQMGICTNLIADMTLKGANEDEIVRAVKHSMVIIDSEKHKLDYKQSEIDQNIKELQRLYQTTVDPKTGVEKSGGASTLLTRAKSQERVNERQKYYDVDADTGRKIYRETGNSFTKKGKNGEEKTIVKQTISSKMYEIDDARKLMSTYGTDKPENVKESLYASYANKLKAMGNEARKEARAIEDRTYSPSAAKTYSEEVSSLKAKLNEALKNAPRERYAQIIANDTVKQKVNSNPGLQEDKDQLKKIRGAALNAARVKAGASKAKVEITDKEWEAIQAGAVSKTTLEKILLNADTDKVKQLATPKQSGKLSASQMRQIKSMAKTNYYTLAQIAAQFGVSTSTISAVIKAS